MRESPFRHIVVPAVWAAAASSGVFASPAMADDVDTAVPVAASESDFGFEDAQPAPVVEEAPEAPPEIFRSELDGSLHLGADGAGSQTDSYLRTFGAGKGFRASETWVETRLHLAWKLPGSDAGFWSFAAYASPLFGSWQEHGDSARIESLRNLREAWISARYAGSWDVNLWGGRRSIEPGAGLYAHPMYVLPIEGWVYSPEGRAWEENNAVLAELGIRTPSGVTATARWFPKLESDSLLDDVFPTQDQAVNVELASQVLEDHSLRLAWFRGAFQEFGASWEWGYDPVQLFAEASVRDQERPWSLVRVDEGNRPGATGWTMEERGGSWWTKVTAGPQIDFDAGPLHRLRASMEYVWSEGGWETSRTREAASVLTELRDIPPDDPRYPEALGLMGSVAGSWDLSEAYRHRAMFRLSSVESMSWNWALNLVGYGPLDALMAKAECERGFADAFVASLETQVLLAYRHDALFAQMPQPWRVWGGITYSFGQDRRSRP